MDAATIQSKIYLGYAKAALRLGYFHDVYRANGPNNPTAPTNIILTGINASFSLDDNFRKPNKYNNLVYRLFIDGTQIIPGDYLVCNDFTLPKSTQQLTWFVAVMDALLPIVAVQCNRFASFFRPAPQTLLGKNPYGGTTQENEVPTQAGWPIAMWQGTKGEKGDVNLPGDVRNPWWNVLLPSTGGVTIQARDIITDDQSRRYIISSAELTEMGWRLVAMQAET